MAQVPYRGFPEGGPENVPLRVEVPGALLEGTRAIESLGRDITGAGDKLWNEAVRLKGLDNETEAIEADSKYIIKVGDLHSKFNALQGEDRVNAYPQFQKDLNESRQQFRAALSNDDSRRRYDFSSLRTMAHAVSDGGRATATADKDWQKNTAIASGAIAKQDFSNDPDGPQGPAKLKTVEDTARMVADNEHGGGRNSVVADKYALIAKSDAIADAIESQARKNANIAEVMMKERWNDLTPNDKNRAQRIVTSQATHQGADIISDRIIAEGKETADKPAATLEEMEAKVEKLVAERDPEGDYPDLKRTTLAALRNKNYITNHAKTFDERTRTTEMTGIITSTNPTSISQLLDNPKAYEIYKSMNPNTRDKEIQGIINSWYRSNDLAQKKKNYADLLSMSTSDVERFMSTPPSEWHVDPGEWQKLMAQRAKILKSGAAGDPRTDKAMKWLGVKYGAYMENEGIIGKHVDRDAFHKFRGTLAVAIDQWQSDNPGKPLTEKVVTDELWKQIRTEATSSSQLPSWIPIIGGASLPWNSTVPAWRTELATQPEVRQDLEKEIMETLPPGSFKPTDSELWIQQQRDFWKLFKNKQDKK